MALIKTNVNYSGFIVVVKSLLILMLTLLSLFFTKNSIAEYKWDIYRNDEFKFRFRYPSEKWWLGAPIGANVRVTLHPPANSPKANCNVLVKNHPDINNQGQQELNKYILSEPMRKNDWKELFSYKWPDTNVIEAKYIKVDNQPAYFGVVEFSNETLERKLHVKGMQWITFTPGLYWQFGCAGKGATINDARKSYQYWLPVFRKMMGSFVFERW